MIHLSRGILDCKSGFPKLKSAAAAYRVCKVSSKIIFRAYTMHNRCTVTNISKWLAITIVAQAVAMKHFWVFTEICLRLSFQQMKFTTESIDICLLFSCFMLFNLVMAADGWSKPELCFFLGRFRWTLLLMED